MKTFKLILDGIIKAMQVMIMCLIAGIVLIMLNELFLRNFLNRSFRGMTESAGCLFIWMAFLGIAVLYHKNRLISLDMVYVKLKGMTKTVIYYIHTIIALSLGIVMIISFIVIYPFVITEFFSSMPNISKFWQFLPLPIAGGFIILKALYNLTEKIFAGIRVSAEEGRS